MELFLALLGHRDDALEPLTQLGVHDGPDVGVSDDGGISRDVGQLGRPCRGGKCLETPAVERDESGAEPGRDDRRGTCHEVTGLFGHARCPSGDYNGPQACESSPFRHLNVTRANRLAQITGTKPEPLLLRARPGVRPRSDPTAPARTRVVRRSRHPSPGRERKWPPNPAGFRRGTDSPGRSPGRC